MPMEPEDFASVIDRAQRVGPADVGSPFAGKEAFVPGRAKGVPDLDYDAHIKVFIMPADSGDYEDVMNKVLRGEAIARYEEKTFTKEGEFIVAMCWLTPRVRAAQPVNYAAGDAEPGAKPKKIA